MTGIADNLQAIAKRLERAPGVTLLAVSKGQSVERIQAAAAAGQKAFGDFTFTGYLRNQEIYATLTIDVSGAPAGDYVLRFHFNDVNSGKSASVDQPFKIAGP